MDSIDLFPGSPALETIPLPDADLQFTHTFYTPIQSAQIKKQLREEIVWRQEKITLWGKEYLQPRLSAWYGEASYSYSGLTLDAKPWITVLQRIKEDVEHLTQHRFNSVLLNLYRNEHDSMGWHSDDEPELGPAPAIASISLGETRVLKLRHKDRKKQKPVSLALTDGSLLLMTGPTQQFWQHAILKEHCSKGERINLTFRRILP